MGARTLATFAVVAALSTSARAQRRDGGTTKSVFDVTIPVSAKFGDVDVPARHYRVSLGPNGIALADPATMLLIATIPAEKHELNEPVKEPKVEVKKTSKTVEICLTHGTTMARAVGRITAVLNRPEAGGRVELVGKQETTLDKSDPEQLSDVQNINNLVKRYFGSIKHCADKAHRNRWITDDPRFVKCMCPIIAKWRMPHVKSELQTHHSLSKGRTGFSITTTTDGRVKDCRVWIGPNPPAPKESTQDGGPSENAEPAKEASAPTSSEGAP